MRQYETGFVLSPTLSEEETTQFIQQMAEIVAQKNGRMVKQDIWGKRRLAFPIKRFQEGVYVFFTYDGAGDVSGELERRHRLVRAQEEVQTRRGRMSRYRFGHVLFQEYLYKRLSPGERRLLHADVATALEKLYEGHLDEVAVQLGHHFHEAGDQGRALPYFTLAAQRAARIHANDEAIRHYTQAIELVGMVSPDAASLAKLHRGRGLACETLGEFDAARADLEAALQMAQVADEHQVEWGVLIDLGKLWASRDYQRTRDHFERALELARRMNDAADRDCDPSTGFTT